VRLQPRAFGVSLTGVRATARTGLRRWEGGGATLVAREAAHPQERVSAGPSAIAAALGKPRARDRYPYGPRRNAAR
jgi:hypothetical protein